MKGDKISSHLSVKYGQEFMQISSEMSELYGLLPLSQ